MKSQLTRLKDAARKRMNRFIEKHPYLHGEAVLAVANDGDQVFIQAQIVTDDPVKQEDLRRLFSKNEIRQANDVPAALAPVVEEEESEDEIAAAVENVTVRDEDFEVAAKPLLAGKPLFRFNSKRARIFDKWAAEKHITLNEVVEITGWTASACAAELYEIAKKVGFKIANSDGIYYIDE